MGINIRHMDSFCIDRPNGSGDYLLVIFKTNALVTIAEREQVVLPNSCILFRRQSKQLYRTTGKTYVDHYIHFACEQGDRFMKEKGIPFDSPFYLNNISEIEEILRMISRDQITESPHKEESIDLLIKLLLLKLSHSASSRKRLPQSSEHHEELLDLRAEIYSNPGKYDAIKHVAEKIKLSDSHFQALYRKAFGISCYDDLLTAKIMSAQYHLTSTNLTVKEIAYLCGYKNDTCFMRSFKKRTGLTPMEYRKQATLTLKS